MTTGAGHRRHQGTAAAVLCLAVTLAGCSSGGSDAGTDSSSSASSPSASTTTKAVTASSTPTATRPPAAPVPTRGPAGQKKFARHVMDLWGYALRTDDARALVALSAPGKKCQGCAVFAASMTKRKQHGWYVDLPALRVRAVTVKQVTDNVYAKALVDVPQSDSYNVDGSFRNTNRPHPGATFEVLMHRGKKRYELLAFTVS